MTLRIKEAGRIFKIERQTVGAGRLQIHHEEHVMWSCVDKRRSQSVQCRRLAGACKTKAVAGSSSSSGSSVTAFRQ